MKYLGALLLFFVGNALAQIQCVPSSPDHTKVVASGSLKTVEGSLADFDPCHRSVQFNMPSLFANKRGEKPPVVIIAHGGGGIGGYEREFAKLMNQNGFASLLYDAFEMNGLASGSNLLLYEMRNSARQRMIYKATLGAYQWISKNGKVDTSQIFVQGLSNGGSVAINMAASTDGNNLKGVIAEGSPAAGIGFPNDINVPLLMIYGSADVYGGTRADDFMHLRGNACLQNDFYELAPKGFSEACHRNSNSTHSMPTPLAWYEQIKAKGGNIQFELVEGGGHGMMFDSFSSSVRSLSGGRSMYTSRGASGDSRTRLEKLVIAFLESKLSAQR
jgi:dienelactone hydrolase